MDATCAIQASIHVFSLVRKYVSRILGTYHKGAGIFYSQRNIQMCVIVNTENKRNMITRSQNV